MASKLNSEKHQYFIDEGFLDYSNHKTHRKLLL